jgi:protein-S-isoprenylcysteine O-methyltransferase Ste14
MSDFKLRPAIPARDRFLHWRNRVLDDRVSSRLGALFFTAWIAQRVVFRPGELLAPTAAALTWWLITFQFVLFVAAFLTRQPVRAPARGFMQTLFPLACAAMPFALVVPYPFRPPVRALTGLWPLPSGLVILGTIVIVAGVMRLRKSFAIMAEVREPVFGGIYRWTRHPMYVGSMLTAVGALLHNFSAWNGFVCFAFCAGQVYRARIEERKLGGQSPEYDRYAATVGWVGRLGRRPPRP